MCSFYFSHLPESFQAFTGKLPGILKQWLSHCVPAIPWRGCRGCYGVWPRGETMCLSSGLFRADRLSTIFIYWRSSKKNSLEKVLLLTLQKRTTVLKDFYGSLLPVTRKWGKLNSAQVSFRNGIHLQTNSFFLVRNNPLKFRVSYGVSLKPGQGARATVLGSEGHGCIILLFYSLILPFCFNIFSGFLLIPWAPSIYWVLPLWLHISS